MSARTDRLQLLEVFLAILENGSMSETAKALTLSPATVTRQMQELERIVGARLLQRDTHDLAATAAGRQFADDAGAVVGGWRDLLTRHAGASRENAALEIIAPIGLGQRILLDLVTDHALLGGKLHVHWRLINGPIVFDREGCDLWVCQGPVPDDSLVVTPIGYLDVVVVASPSYTPALAVDRPEELNDLEMIAHEPHYRHEIELVSSDGERARVRANARMVTNNFPSLLRAASRGLGFAIVPRLFAANELRSGELRLILPAWRAERLVINLARAPSPVPRAALDDLVAYLKRHVPRLSGVEPAFDAPRDPHVDRPREEKPIRRKTSVSDLS